MIPISKPFIGEEEINAVVSVLKSGTIAQGPKVAEAEAKFARLCGTRFAVATNSGTSALHSAIFAAGIKPGDEVITTPFTFIATANTILMHGAKPIFAHIKEESFNINPEEVKKKITRKTKAILAVDLYGNPCDYDSLNKIAKENNLVLVDDAAQSVNAEYKGKKAGNFADISSFSFYATKNITAGEGGMLTTSNEGFAEKARLMRQHGRSKMTNYEYSGLGYNYRMTDIAAAILLEQLKKADFITSKRIEIAAKLTKGLKGVKGIITPSAGDGAKHVFHQYTIRINNEFGIGRENIIEKLGSRGINTDVYYPKPLHLIEHFAAMGYKQGDFPAAEKAANEVLSLPVHPSLSDEDIRLIVDSIRDLE